MPLQPKAIEILEDVKAHILINPKFYDQDEYAVVTECGSVCCVAGWVDYVANGPAEHEKHLKKVNYFDWWGNACRILGITRFDGGDLFPRYFFHCDVKFRSEYRNAETDKGRAKAAAGMIDRFIAANRA